jgi:hypothetical protein
MHSQTLRGILRSSLPSVVLIAAACGGGGDIAGTGDTNSGGVHMTAKIDGTPWASGAAFITVVQVLPGAYAITGTQSSTTNAITMTISLANIRGPGTFPLGVGPGVPGGSVILANSSTGWASPMSGADGSITITSLTDTQIAGTFNFVVTGSAGTRTVTDGDFVASIKKLSTIGAIPDNAGSTFNATIGGSTWNAAFVSGGVTTSALSPVPTLAIGATNSTRGVMITLTGVTGPGTYTLGNSGSVTRQMGVTNVANPFSNMWTSVGGGASGSVIITSMTATRIKGTFSATLVPSPGSATTGNLTVANGVFDIGF